MPVEIKVVKTAAQRRKFVKFPEKLYKHSPYYVPNLVFDEMSTLNPKTNPATEFCDSELYLAYKDGELVGRVAAIINNKANEQWNHKEVRFGWFDFVDDKEVSGALIDKVIEFGKAHGMDKCVGPLGFTDFDPEGMLVDGYESLCTMALIYNHPYYVEHIETLGFEKDIDWTEYKIFIGEQLPDKIRRIAEIVEQRTNVKIRPITKKILKEEDYGHKLFHLINECYKGLYDYTVMPDEMADKYLGFYLSLLDLNFVTIAENDKGEPVAFGIIMPSLAKTLQKSRGELFPFGWFHLLKTLHAKKLEGAEMLLIGVRPDYQNSGLNAMIMYEAFKRMKSYEIKWAETNAILETNIKNQGPWQFFEHEQKKRRRSYFKMIG